LSKIFFNSIANSVYSVKTSADLVSSGPIWYMRPSF